MASGSGKVNKKTTASGASRSSGAKGGKKPRKASAPAASKKQAAGGFGDEISILVTVAVAIILVLGCFDLAGDFGKYVNNFMFGLIGVMEYILPIILVVSAFFLVANKQLAIVRIKVGVAFIMVMCMSGFVQKLYGVPDVTQGIGHFYSNSAQEHVGGGFVGGLICKLLNPLGTGGTYVVLILLIIICLLFITERSIIKGIQKGGRKMIDTARDDYEVYREYSSESRRRRQAEEEQAEEEYREYARARKERREQRLEELRQKEEEAAKKPKRRDKKARGVVLAGDTPGEPEPRLIAGGDLTELTIGVEDNLSTFDIQDGYSKDIYDPNSAGYGDETDDPQGDAQASEAVAEAESGVFVNTDIMPVKAAAVHGAGNDGGAVHTASHASEGTAGTASHASEGAADTASRASEGAAHSGASAVKPGTADVPGDAEKPHTYKFPPLSLLKEGKRNAGRNGAAENEKTARKLQQTLQNFGVHVTITGTSCGPTVTRYELQPEQGTKVAKIVSLSDDIKLNLAASDIRIEAPIPGKSAIGIEVPNKEATGVSLRELLESREFKEQGSPIAFAAGKDIAGNVVVADIAKMPHVLIAGATGSGKSVCINTIIMSILYKARPDQVRLILIDPKVVELSVYNGIPHLSLPVVTDPKKAASTLNWAVTEMTDRYNKFAEMGVRDLKGYNEKLKSTVAEEELRAAMHMPQIVIIIDELADLMMVASGEVEDAICRLAQLARAAGIHLVIATQRPSVNVVTGLIKANVPSRIAFSVSSGVDSRTILDMNGAEKLLGKGDMLFYPSGYAKPVRVQGAFVSDDEVAGVVEFLKSNGQSGYDEEAINRINSGVQLNAPQGQASGDDRDEYFADAGRFIIEKEKASIGMLQRYYKIGFNRAARIMDQLSDAGIVGPEEGTKPRKILMSADEFEEYLRQH